MSPKKSLKLLLHPGIFDEIVEPTEEKKLLNSSAISRFEEITPFGVTIELTTVCALGFNVTSDLIPSQVFLMLFVFF